MQLIAKKPTATFVTMTRELVDALLVLNTKNRCQRPEIIKSYRRAMDNNFWVTTNQGIGVAASGFLVDGQHRLEALRAAGYPPVQMLVVTGLPDEAMAAVDGGRNRSPRDYLQLLFDTKISSTVSAILRTSMIARDDFAVTKYSPQEFAEHFEKMGDSIAKIMKLATASRLPAAVAAALVDAHRKGYHAETEAFATALLTGEMLERDNPALLLRNWISNNHGSGGSIILKERYSKTTRALQAWIDRRPLGKLYSSKTPMAEALDRWADQKTVRAHT